MVKHHLHTIDIGDHKTKLYNSKTINFTKSLLQNGLRCRAFVVSSSAETSLLQLKYMRMYETVFTNCLQKPLCTMQRLASENLMTLRILLHLVYTEGFSLPLECCVASVDDVHSSISKRF
jgi:hypothetical protein